MEFSAGRLQSSNSFVSTQASSQGASSSQQLALFYTVLNPPSSATNGSGQQFWALPFSQPPRIPPDANNPAQTVVASQPISSSVCNVCLTAKKRKFSRYCSSCGLSYHLSCVKLSQRQSLLLQTWSCPRCSLYPRQNYAPMPSPERPSTPRQIILAVTASRRSSPILLRIPKGARILAAEALSTSIESALRTNVFSDWVKVFSFASVCFAGPSCDSVRTCSLATFTKRQINTFKTKSLPDLLRPPKFMSKASELRPSDEYENQRLRSRVKSKLLDGDVSAAVRVLASEDAVAPPTPEVLEAITSKHPSAPDDFAAPSRPNSDDVPEFSKQAVLNAIKSFPSSSSGGIDGLRPGHLRDLIARDTGEAGQKLLSSLTSLVNHFARGNLDDCARVLFFSARLIALRKKDGGLRPIAIGNTLRRLASKVLTRSVAHDLSTELQPIQLGFGVRGGCESAVHATRLYIDKQLNLTNDPHVMVKLDVKNAFNTLRRDILLEVLKSRAPNTYPLAWLAYSSSSHLLFEDFFVDSCTGIQQGDPLGPLAFALAVDKVARSVTSPFNIWYLDDATIAGPLPTVLKDLKRIIPSLSAMGLHINPSKCEIINLGSPQATFQSFQDELSELIPTAVVTHPNKLHFLGSPILLPALKDFLPTKKEVLVKMTKRLQLIDAHPAFFLLKNCLSVPKLMYTLRSSPCYQLPDQLAEFDATIKDSVSAICNVDFENFSWKQAVLPVRSGGLGIRLPSDLSMPAYFSSLSANNDLVIRILSRINESVSPHTDERSLWTDKGLRLPDSPESQRAWDDISCQSKIHHLKETLDQTRLAVFEGAASSHSGAWLNVVPNPTLGNFLDDGTLRTAIALRVGAKVCEEHQCRCGLLVDRFGHHPLSCKRSAGRLPRHSALNAVFKRALERAGIPSILEPSGLDRGDGKRPDGMTCFPFSMGRALLWDATCSDTYAPNALFESAINPGSSAERAEQRKIQKYASLTDRYCFEPLSFETSGAVGPRTLQTLTKLGDRLSRAMDDKRETEWLFQRLSLAIVRGNAICIFQAGIDH